jgi:DNA-binding SARP family transcriptional activator
VRFLVLGHLAVEDDGHQLVGRGPRKQALLGRLLVDANRIVRVDALLEAMWHGRVPRSAFAALHTHISQLRRTVGNARLSRHADGYRLSVADGELDADAFGTDLIACERALSDGDPQTATRLADRALGRWRGDALGALGGAGWALPYVARLEELRLTALDRAIEARLHAGHADDAAALAHGAVAQQPLRERSGCS